MADESGERKSSVAVWIILLALSVILNVYQWQHHSTTINTYEQKVDTLIVERVNVEKELSDTKTELNKYHGISANLDSLLKKANSDLDRYEKNIKDITRTEKNTAELNRKMKEVGSSRVDLQACKLEYSIVSPK